MITPDTTQQKSNIGDSKLLYEKLRFHIWNTSVTNKQKSAKRPEYFYRAFDHLMYDSALNIINPKA